MIIITSFVLDVSIVLISSSPAVPGWFCCLPLCCHSLPALNDESAVLPTERPAFLHADSNRIEQYYIILPFRIPTYFQCSKEREWEVKWHHRAGLLRQKAPLYAAVHLNLCINENERERDQLTCNASIHCCI